MSAIDVRKTIKLTAQTDRATYKRVRIRLPKDPGQAGKEQAESYIKFLAGFNVVAVAETGSKEARAEPHMWELNEKRRGRQKKRKKKHESQTNWNKGEGRKIER